MEDCLSCKKPRCADCGFCHECDGRVISALLEGLPEPIQELLLHALVYGAVEVRRPTREEVRKITKEQLAQMVVGGRPQ
jgi:hypothetical protein